MSKCTYWCVCVRVLGSPFLAGLPVNPKDAHTHNPQPTNTSHNTTYTLTPRTGSANTEWDFRGDYSADPQDRDFYSAEWW